MQAFDDEMAPGTFVDTQFALAQFEKPTKEDLEGKMGDVNWEEAAA